MTTLAVTSSNSGLKLDPRTKFTLMIAVSVIMAGGSSAGAEYILRVICAALPFALLLSVRQIRSAVLYF